MIFLYSEPLPLFSQVTFKDMPLSYYLMNMEAEGNTPQTCLDDSIQHYRPCSPQELLRTGLLFLSDVITVPHTYRISY